MAAEIITEVEEIEEKKLTDRVVNLGKCGFYTALGVVDVVQTGLHDLVKRGKNYRQTLQERGEKMAEQNRGRVTELVEKPQTMAKDTAKKASETFEKYSEEVLTRAHIPTTDQFDNITKKVGAVDKKLDKMIKETAAAEKI